MLKNVLTIVAVLGLNTALFSQEVAQRTRRTDKRVQEQPTPDARCANPNGAPPDCALSDRVPPAYNMSARIDPDRSYDVFLNASFIYWNVSQEYMDIGRTALYETPAEGGNSHSNPAPNATVFSQPSDYQPGFKVGLGFGTEFDNWQFDAEYTYFRNSNRLTAGPSLTATAAVGSEIIIPNEWYVNLSINGPVQASRISSRWKVGLDQLDASLSRPFYQGQRLNVTPYMGLRALWLRQTLNITSNFAIAPTVQPAVSNNESKAWALGPNIGADFNWLLGMGFRLEVDAGMSLLYMRYTTLTHTESWPADPEGVRLTGDAPFVNGSLPARGHLRAVNEVGLGFGWGTYCCNKRFHIDFSARYDFAAYWAQNMMRYAVGTLANNYVGYSNPMGDLYLHGLTLTSRFDF